MEGLELEAVHFGVAGAEQVIDIDAVRAVLS
jgi:hypothetical protein